MNRAHLSAADAMPGGLGSALRSVLLDVGIDWAALYAQELLTRDAMREDLRTALTEQLQSVSQAMGCP